MGIFDALTGDAGHQAATQQRNVLAALVPNLATAGQAAYGQAGQSLQQGYGQARTDLGQGYDASTGAINTGAGGALNFLQQGAQTAQGQLGQGYGASTGAINTGAGDALGYLQGGTQGALGQLGQARDVLTAGGGAYQPLTDLAGQYGKGANLYADSLGINGAGGNQNAVNAFQTGPGYQFARDQGLEAITRHANAAGGLGGNSLRDTITYGQGLANQEYGKYQDRLSAFNPLQLAATQGAASGNQANNTTLASLGVQGAGLLSNQSGREAQIAQGQGNSLSDIARQYYGGLGGLSTNLGSAQAGVASGQGNTLANLAQQYFGNLGAQDIGGGTAQANNTIGGAQNWQGMFGKGLDQYNDTYKQDAKASTDASTNSLNLGMNLAKLGMSAFGGSNFNPLSLTQSQAFQNNNWGY